MYKEASPPFFANFLIKWSASKIKFLSLITLLIGGEKELRSFMLSLSGNLIPCYFGQAFRRVWIAQFQCHIYSVHQHGYHMSVCMTTCSHSLHHIFWCNLPDINDIIMKTFGFFPVLYCDFDFWNLKNILNKVCYRNTSIAVLCLIILAE